MTTVIQVHCSMQQSGATIGGYHLISETLIGTSGHHFNSSPPSAALHFVESKADTTFRQGGIFYFKNQEGLNKLYSPLVILSTEYSHYRPLLPGSLQTGHCKA